jgi:hypothetical protein
MPVEYAKAIYHVMSLGYRDLEERPKGDAAKLELARRLRKETTLTIRQIAERLSMGSWKSLNNKLYLLDKQTNAK